MDSAYLLSQILINIYRNIAFYTDAVAVKRLPAGSESEDTLSASEGEGQGEGSRLHSQSPEATSRQTVMTVQQTEEVTMRRREDLSGPTSGESL